jgi:HEPN domain-containing protein
MTLAIFKLFSQREEEAKNAGVEDVYQYDAIPLGLRNQIIQIATDGIGRGSSSNHYGTVHNEWWGEIEEIFIREKGKSGLGATGDARLRIAAFMRDCTPADWLDFAELIAVAISAVGKPNHHDFRSQWGIVGGSDELIDEMNYRLRRAKVGYQLEGNNLIRIDSQFVHAEVVKPALALLSKPGFEGPAEEFRDAHRHYRDGENRQAVSMAANALESTLKAVFDKKNWEYKKGARISDLLKVGRANNLWPDYLDQSFEQLVATIQSGLPKIRDNDASHGQGAIPKDVPEYIAAYALHLAASKIVFIVSASGE